jgi:hypothetical protein
MNLVLVHLGPSYPKYLLKNLKYLKDRFQKLDITLIGDNPIKKFDKIEINFVRAQEDYLENYSHLFIRSEFDVNFRSGFWRLSIIRIFELLDYIILHDLNEIIHIESDVLLSQSFPFEKFKSLNNPAWLRFNQTHDVASILYIPNKEAAAWLKNQMIRIIAEHDSLTDMTLLSIISHESSENISLLPIAEGVESPLFRSTDVSEEEKKRLTILYAHFGGVFDSAPIGMWLLGQDPRNHRGLLRRFITLSESYIDPSRAGLSSSENAPRLSYGNESIEIFNLHVHCKDPSAFKSSPRDYNNKYIIESLKNGKKTTFKATVFLSLSVAYAKKHKFLSIKKFLNQF